MTRRKKFKIKNFNWIAWHVIIIHLTHAVTYIFNYVLYESWKEKWNRWMFNISNEWLNWTNAKSQVKIYRHLNSLCKKVNLFLSIDGNGKDYPWDANSTKTRKEIEKALIFMIKLVGKHIYTNWPFQRKTNHFCNSFSK